MANTQSTNDKDKETEIKNLEWIFGNFVFQIAFLANGFPVFGSSWNMMKLQNFVTFDKNKALKKIMRKVMAASC